MRVGLRLTRVFSGLASVVPALVHAVILGVALAIAQAGPVPAQDSPAAAPVAAKSVLLSLDQERLFSESAYGKASLAREGTAARALEAENGRIEAELIAEEQDLTTRRATLPAEEFAALATAFDAKVVRIRNEQDAKARDLTRARELDRQNFLRAMVPVLGEVMSDRGAVAILDKSTLIISLTAIDVTDEAITRIDAVLGDGSTPPAAP